MKRVVIGILAHVDAGKTTLSEAVLYSCGKLRRLGRVDKKDAFLDNYTLERERGITIFSKQAVFERGGVSFTLLDTPGHVDFSTEMERTLSVLDMAVLVVSGPEGVQAHTRTLWKLLKAYDIPTFIFVNKMDRDGCDKGRSMRELKELLSDSIVDFTSPDYLESVAVCDETLMEDYLETGELADESITGLIMERKVFPCFFGSALKCEGVEALLDGLARFAPQCYDDGAFAARVYKTTRDDEGNRLTFLKVTGGEIKSRDILEYMPSGSRDTSDNTDRESDPDDVMLSEKITGIRIYSGEKYEPADRATIGMLAAVTGLTATYPGQALGAEEESFDTQLVPVMTYRLVEQDRSKVLALLPKLRLMEEEEPSLHIIWNSEVKELQVRIMGEIQLEVLKSRFKERFGEEIEFDRGSILYKETIASPVLGVGHYEPLRHYAEAQLLIEPGAQGSGIVAVSDLSTNDLDLNWQRLILTHIYEREHKGVLTGSGLTDVKITLVAGRAHLKHTEGGDFRQATYRAIRQGLMQAESVLLEPWYEFTIELPREMIGRAMSDIDKRSGKITAQYETDGKSSDMVVLTGRAPVSTMQGYVKDVTAYTKGLGSIDCVYCGYFPCHDQDEVVAAMAYDPAADLRNPASSVFCAHGAGFVVEWNEVGRYKHVECSIRLANYSGPEASDISDNANDADYSEKGIVIIREAKSRASDFAGGGGSEHWVGTDEIDSILDRTFNANRRSSERRNPYRKHKAADAERLKKLRAMSSQTSDPKYERPQAHRKDRYLLVDGYNIIHAWPELADLMAVNVDGARDRLNDILCDYQAMHDCSLIVVYDAYRVAGHPTTSFKYNNITLVFTKEAETADRFIERFAHENAKQYDVTVATSDGLEQIIIRGAGCALMTAADLAHDVSRTRDEVRDKVKPLGGKIGTSLGDIMDSRNTPGT